MVHSYSLSSADALPRVQEALFELWQTAEREAVFDKTIQDSFGWVVCTLILPIPLMMYFGTVVVLRSENHVIVWESKGGMEVAHNVWVVCAVMRMND